MLRLQKFIFVFLGTCIVFLNSIAQESKRIEILNANTTEFNEALGKDAFRLLGNVIFEHNEVIMHCDSAYYYKNKNMVDAFSNIHINQGDTLHLYGDFLHYNGTKKMANVRDNVRLLDNQQELTTEFLDYDIGNDVGYYFNGGIIVDGENRLESMQGYYYTNTNTYVFSDSVVITNPDYIINSDTVKYNTDTKISYFFGPTEIISDSNYIYCEDGWYDTQKDISEFRKNAFIENDEYHLKGDTIYYDRNAGIGRALSNVEFIDTTNNVLLKGNLGTYNEFTEFAMLTDSAVMVQVYKEDSLYLHADTLFSLPDTLDKKTILGYHRVKFYRTNMQGKCDSIVYQSYDSLAYMHGSPVVWNEDKQITAEELIYKVNDDGIERMYMNQDAFIAMQHDSLRYDQISGKNMVAFFRDNDLYRINVDGNGKTIYYPVDNEEIIGVNKAESSNMVIYVSENKVQRIVFVNQADATLYPLEDLPVSEAYLSGFDWLDEFRPLSKEEIFIWP